ncbi:MAG: hypothetical protein AB7K52_01145 [Phycisphaerales bacterium]
MHSPPPRWRRLSTYLLAAGAILILFAVWVFYKAMQPPGKPGRYADAMDAHVLEGQPADGPNGWDLLVDINDVRVDAEAAVFTGPDADERRRNLDYSALYMPLDPDDRSDPEAVFNHEQRVADARRVLEAIPLAEWDRSLDELARSKRAFRPITRGPIVAMLLPDLGQTRATARLLAARMRLAAEAGDLDARARTFEHLLAVGRVAGRQSTLIDRLVGLAVVSLALHRLREDLVAFPLPPGQAGAVHAQRLADILDRQARFEPLARVMQRERLGILDTLELVCTDDGAGDGWVMPARIRSLQALDIDTLNTPMSVGERLMTAAAVVLPSKKQYVAKTDLFFARLSSICDQTRPVRRSLPSADLWIETELSPRYFTLSLLLPALERAASVDEVLRMHIAGTRLMLDLEHARRVAGSPPPSLDALALVTKRPLPIDPVSGTRFGYRVLSAADADPLGRAYLLYSVGDDAIDDDGVQVTTPTLDRLEAVNGSKGHGFDYVLNHADAPAARP